jgi:hypothetical protein
MLRLWLIVLITDLADDAAAVVVVLHHVLADGLGGLNVLAALLDPGAPPAAVPFPRASPTRRSPARDAWRTRLLGMRRAARLGRSLRRSTFAGGGFRPARATPCSLVQRRSASKDGGGRAGSRFAESRSASEWGYDERCGSGVLGAALHQYLLSRERVSRSDSRYRAGFRSEAGRRAGDGQHGESNAGRRRHRRGCRRTA